MIRGRGTCCGGEGGGTCCRWRRKGRSTPERKETQGEIGAVEESVAVGTVLVMILMQAMKENRSLFCAAGSGDDCTGQVKENSGVRLHACRCMDEIFIAVSGPKETALNLKTEIQNYLKNSLNLDVNDQREMSSLDSPDGIQFLGSLIQNSIRDSSPIKAVHKLKDKVQLFAAQKLEAWDAGTVRIGKKWLAHGLKKIKESEIKHLADNNSILNQISHHHKEGSRTGNTIFKRKGSFDFIKKSLPHYGLVNSEGYPQRISPLLLQDDIQIIHWFQGLVRRWLKWYHECDNFGDVKFMIVEHVRNSCIRTLASKHRMQETLIEKRFELELSGIPSITEIEPKIMTTISNSQPCDEDESLMYGIMYNRLCFLSLAKCMVLLNYCYRYLRTTFDGEAKIPWLENRLLNSNSSQLAWEADWPM
ncbi:hypothetical protein ACLOJK_018481 [Asimina triloba]